MISRIKFEIEPLVEEILDQLPAEVWSSATTTFLDPAMGGGQFVRAIEHRLREAGHSDKNIFGRVHGCESTVLHVNYAVNKHNLVGNYGVCDFLEKDFGDMKFDVVVGNPPYKRGGDKNFYVGFVKKAKDILHDGGFFSFVIPNRFLSPSSIGSKSFAQWLSVTEVRPSVNNHFPDIGTSIGTVSGVKVVNATFKKVPFIFENGDRLIRSLNQPTPIVNPTKLTTTIVSKVFDSDLPKISVNTINKDSNYVFVEVSYNRYRSTTPTGGEKTLVTAVNTAKGTGGYINFQSKKHAELNSWFLSRSKLGRFIIYCFANTAFATSSPVHHGFMPELPEHIQKNDKDLYEYFNLTDDEISEIERVIL